MTGPKPDEPWATMPPYKPGQPLEDAITDALMWETQKRLATGPRTTYEQWARANAKITLRTIERDRIARRSPEHSAVPAPAGTRCDECGRSVYEATTGTWKHL